MANITVVGGGRIGEALVSGLSGAGGDDVSVVEANADRGRDLAERYGVRVGSVAETVPGADLVVVAVKPGDVAAVVREIGAAADAAAVVVSLAAGISTAAIAAALPEGRAVVRVMPNTAMLVGAGTAAVCAGAHAGAAAVEAVVAMMETVGSAVVVDEKHMDAVTSLSGSGPAYFFLLAEAMVDAGVEQGLTRDVALRLVAGTAAGAGRMLAGAGDGPVELRAAVTSPGGTTAAALRRFETGALRATVADAVEACARRSAEIGAAADRAAGA